MEEKKFMEIIEMVQISYLNTEAMIREDGKVFIKVSRSRYFDKKHFIESYVENEISYPEAFIKERLDLFDSITKYAKGKYNL